MAQMSASTVESDARPPDVDGQVPVVKFDQVTLAFDEKVVLKDLSFTLQPGRLKVFLGASGAGKSTILRLILGLLRPDAGEIWVHGQRVDQLSEAELMPVRSDVGMVFQEGALFDSLTVRENVGYRLYEQTRQPLAEVDQRVDEVLGFVGLPDMSDRMPSELSGGQRRRVAIARALTSRPKLLLYDEPTTGLDPITALTVDAEIVKLRDLEHTSSIVVTHQLRDAFYIATHRAKLAGDRVEIGAVPPEDGQETEFVMLKSGGIVFEGTAAELRATTDPYLRSFLS
jgi:phospholipid/cholesterol/gamma-HCH transport system ATP-binding protein